MKYKTNDGQEYVATSAVELVEAMRRDSRSPSSSIEDFMGQVAHRCKLSKGSEISTKEAGSFIQDLLDEGFLEELSTLNLDTSWISQMPTEQKLLLFFALHHYQEQVEGGSPVGAGLLNEFPQDWLIELKNSLTSVSRAGVS